MAIMAPTTAAVPGATTATTVAILVATILVTDDIVFSWKKFIFRNILFIPANTLWMYYLYVTVSNSEPSVIIIPTITGVILANICWIIFDQYMYILNSKKENNSEH